MTAVLCLLVLTLYTYTSHNTNQPSPYTTSNNHLSFPLHPVPDTAVHQALLARLNSTNAAHRATAEATEDELNLKLDYMSLDEYREMLEDVFLDIFALSDTPSAPSTHTHARGADSSPRTVRVAAEVGALAKHSFSFVEPATFPSVDADVEVAAHGDGDDAGNPSCTLFPQRPPIPHILNTIVRSDADLPPAFSNWRSTLPTDWDITVWNESTCESWLEAHTADPSSLSSFDLDNPTTFNRSAAIGEGKGATPALLDIYRTLPLGVVKSDLFRYIITYFRGGIYSDSDTAPTQPVDLWMMPGPDEVEDLTPPGVLAAETPLRYQVMLQRTGCDIEDREDWAFVSPSEGAPQLIVALESSPSHWRGITEVGLQLVQYAFASSPGHPVFLDIMSRVVSTSRTVAQQTEEGDFRWNDDNFILTKWSGPGLWTEAVYRYLGARWGFDVRLLDGMDLWDEGDERKGRGKKGVRVGDVLILRRDAFRGRWKTKEERKLEEEEEREKAKAKARLQAEAENGNNNSIATDPSEITPDTTEEDNEEQSEEPLSNPPESARYIRHGSFGFGRWRAGTERAMAQMKELEDAYAAKKQAERERLREKQREKQKQTLEMVPGESGGGGVEPELEGEGGVQGGGEGEGGDENGLGIEDEMSWRERERERQRERERALARGKGKGRERG